MIGTKTKDPDAIKPVFLDWSEYVEQSQPQVAEDDAIVGSSWDIPVGLTQEGAGFEDKKTLVFLSGGTEHDKYEVRNHVTLRSGISDTRSFLLVIEKQ